MNGWQQRRSRLSHDWLKNRYLNRLDGVLALLGSAPDPGVVLREYLQEDLPEWEAQAPALQALVHSFATDMSPAALLDSPPLSLLPDGSRVWLAGELERCWRERLPVEDLWQQAQAALAAAAQAYGELAAAAGSPGLPLLEAFRQACGRLAESLAAFPHEVQVA